jgi:hypothetical protein
MLSGIFIHAERMIFFSLKITGESWICNLQSYKTNVDSLLALLWNSPGTPPFLHHVNPLDVSMNLQYLVKLTEVDLHLFQAFSNLYANLIYNDCVQERVLYILIARAVTRYSQIMFAAEFYL